jgi:adenine phosphoribosyltransferase
MDLKSKIREISDWPIKGVSFKDITTIFEDKDTLKEVVDQLCSPYKGKKLDKIVAIDARGFLLATPMAYILKTGVCLVRKKGKLPYKTVRISYTKEYGPDTLTIHKDTIKPNEKVLIVDDLLATGGTMWATVKLVEKLKGKIKGIACIIDLPFLGGSKKLSKYKQHYLVSYDKE